MLILLQGVSADQATTSLNYNEGLLLHLLDSEPEQNVKDLAESLKLERSWVSRIVSSLEQRELVNAFVPEADKRSKKLVVTRKGKTELQVMDTFRRVVMQERLKELSSQEQKELAELLKLLSDGLKAPQNILSSESHPVDLQLARLSWAVGVVGNDFFGSGLNVTQFQTLFTIIASERIEVSTSQLFETLPFDLSTISRTIAGFARQGLLEKQTSERDRRSFSVILSSKGKARWQEIERAGTEMMRNAMRNFSAEQLKRLLELLEKSNRAMPARIKHDSLEKLELKKASTPEHMHLAEEFLKSRFGSKHAPSPAGLKRDRYTISIDNKLKAVVDLMRSEQDGSLTHFLFASEGLHEKDCLQLVRSCMRVG